MHNSRLAEAGEPPADGCCAIDLDPNTEDAVSANLDTGRQKCSSLISECDPSQLLLLDERGAHFALCCCE